MTSTVLFFKFNYRSQTFWPLLELKKKKKNWPSEAEVCPLFSSPLIPLFSVRSLPHSCLSAPKAKTLALRLTPAPP
jgi:hypothetical protein